MGQRTDIRDRNFSLGLVSAHIRLFEFCFANFFKSGTRKIFSGIFKSIPGGSSIADLSKNLGPRLPLKAFTTKSFCGKIQMVFRKQS
jgi:hypothetical protein